MRINLTKELIIQKLNLIPHPEGGFYKETYRSTKGLKNEDFPEFRNYSTAIYYLLGEHDRSNFHRIKQDELWHFYSGDPIQLHEIDLEGRYFKTTVGLSDTVFTPQYMVKAGHYFAAECLGHDYSLTGCTVAPGFDFKDFEMPTQEDLIKQFPDHSEIIKQFS